MRSMRRGSTGRRLLCTAKAARTKRPWPSSSRPAGRSSAGVVAISTSAAQRRWSSSRTASCEQRGTRAEAEQEWSSMVEIRHADPADAEQLVELGRAVGSEPEGWLISVDGWRSVADERRYLKAIRRYPH